jgi:hypothetical protein
MIIRSSVAETNGLVLEGGKSGARIDAVPSA